MICIRRRDGLIERPNRLKAAKREQGDGSEEREVAAGAGGQVNKRIGEGDWRGESHQSDTQEEATACRR